MNKDEIRIAFRQELGDARYLKFLGDLHGICEVKRRLLFWQRELWEDFAARHSLAANSFSAAREAFFYCHVHGAEFQTDVVPIIYGTLAPPSEAQLRQIAQHPYAREEVHGPCWVEKPTKREVFFCQVCRDTRAAMSHASDPQ